MYYGSTTEATSWDKEELNSWKSRAIYLLLFFIPKANPDNENKFHLVKKWLLEVNDEGIPEREIALGENETILFTSPNNRNTGLWTDGPDLIKEKDLQSISKEHFEKLWSSLNTNA